MNKKPHHEAERRNRRRAELKRILGGVCEICGSIEKLEFNHKDPNEKKFNISEGLSKSWNILLEEVSKCQLLCKKCHREKTATYRRLKMKHGTEWMYRKYCRCTVCINGFSDMRKLRPSRQSKKKNMAQRRKEFLLGLLLSQT